MRKEMEEAKEELKALLIEKKTNYAQYVKDVHVPNVSWTKQKELENLMQRIKHPVRESVSNAPGKHVICYKSASNLNRSHS